MSCDFKSDLPIFLQIIDCIEKEIISGKLKPNEKLLSVREYALEFNVNPNTIQKSLAVLEEEGLIITDRTNGKFVTTDEKIIEKIKNKIISERIKEFVKDMNNIGIDKDEVIKKIIEVK